MTNQEYKKKIAPILGKLDDLKAKLDNETDPEKIKQLKAATIKGMEEFQAVEKEREAAEKKKWEENSKRYAKLKSSQASTTKKDSVSEKPTSAKKPRPENSQKPRATAPIENNSLSFTAEDRAKMRKSLARSQQLKHKKAQEQAASSIQAIGQGVEQYDGTAFAPITAIAAGASVAKAINQIGAILILWIVRGFIAPAEMVLRWKHGERYYGFMPFVSMMAIYGILPHLMELPLYIGIGFMIVLSLRISSISIHCFIRDRSGEYWHSYSQGNSFLSGIIDEFFAKLNFTFEAGLLLLEPLALAVVGGVTHIILEQNSETYFPPTGDYINIHPLTGWLYLLAIVCFFYQLYCFLYRRSLLLDELDQEIVVEARKLSRTQVAKPGIFEHRGVPYIRKGGKSPWRK